LLEFSQRQLALCHPLPRQLQLSRGSRLPNGVIRLAITLKATDAGTLELELVLQGAPLPS
jgi:hypothetical protein